MQVTAPPLNLRQKEQKNGTKLEVNANLLEIKDHYPKYVVTLEELAAGNINGIKILYLTFFLLAEDY